MSDEPEGYTEYRIGEALHNGDLVRQWLSATEGELIWMADHVESLTIEEIEVGLRDLASRQVGWFKMLGYAE